MLFRSDINRTVPCVAKTLVVVFRNKIQGVGGIVNVCHIETLCTDLDGRELMVICGTLELKLIDRVATVTWSAVGPKGITYIPYIPTWHWLALPELLVWLREGNWGRGNQEEEEDDEHIGLHSKDSLAA